MITFRISAAIVLVILLAGSAGAQAPLLDQGRAASARGEIDTAVSLLEKYAAQNPNSPEAHYYLGGAYSAQAQAASMFTAPGLLSKTLAEYEKAVALNPKYVDARYALVQIYATAPSLMGGSVPKAGEHADKIKAIDPIVGHRAYAYMFTQQKRPDLAVKELTLAIAEFPASGKAHSYYGQYLSNTEKNYAAAAAEFEAALKAEPGYTPAYYHLGRTAALSKTGEARGVDGLKKYLVYTPKDNEPTLANAHYYLGLIYENQGRRADAKAEYSASLGLNPSFKDAQAALKRVS
jgi:tetratricopeptide (TPR) repeat protein